jgi:hypothetical protein
VVGTEAPHPYSTGEKTQMTTSNDTNTTPTVPDAIREILLDALASNLGDAAGYARRSPRWATIMRAVENVETISSFLALDLGDLAASSVVFPDVYRNGCCISEFVEFDDDDAARTTLANLLKKVKQKKALVDAQQERRDANEKVRALRAGN